ncbi:hypothetical protein D3C87_1668450 [compost metagenome]
MHRLGAPFTGHGMSNNAFLLLFLMQHQYYHIKIMEKRALKRSIAGLLQGYSSEHTFVKRLSTKKGQIGQFHTSLHQIWRFCVCQL